MTVSAYTPNFKLALIDFNSQNWHGDEWDNLMLIDAILKADFASAPFTVASGTNTLTLDYTPNVTAYTSGLTLLFKLTNAPTGAVTINADGLGAKDLLIAGAAIVTGDLIAGDIVRALYDGTQFNVVEPVRVFAKLSLNAGAYGGSDPITTADNLIIRDSNSAGISILTPNTASGIIAFGDQDDNDVGTIVYNHNTDKLIYTSALGHSFVGSTAVTGSLAVTGAITQAGNQVYHAGNFTPSDYAAKAGATFTGTIVGTAAEAIRVAGTAPYIQAYNAAQSTPYGSVGFTSTFSYLAAPSGSNSVKLIANSVDALIATGTGVAVTGTFTASGAIKEGANQVWHAGNLTPSNYLALTGGTVTGAIIRSGKGAHLYHDATYTSGRIVVQAQSGASYTGFADGDFSFEY